MAKFIKGQPLNGEIENIFSNATDQIIIITPYIKLHTHNQKALSSKKSNDKLSIVIVFGKNKDDKTKSFDKDTFEFFSEFPNIKICYQENLHAKYYANESNAIITSMNLYEYSQNNNIEAGILTKNSLLKPLGDSIDYEAWEFFAQVIEEAEVLYEKKPVYDSGFLNISNKYKESTIKIDLLSKLYNSDKGTKSNVVSSQITSMNSNSNAYCIRTRTPIAFNINKPYCDAAFESWSKYKNEDFKEKYCHFSGDESNGETTKAKPILKKHWKEAKSIFNF
jgi:hypothetical protein